MVPPRSSSALDDRPQPADAPAPAGRGHRSWRQRALLMTGVVVVLGIVLAVCGVGYAIWRFSQLRTEHLNLAKAESGGPQNYLIVGSDTRAGISKSDPSYALFNGDNQAPTGQRSDTIMVLRIDPSKGTAKLLSFPRDLWIPIWGTGGNQRINTAYSNGPQPLINTIEQDFGIPINHYVEVNFESFRDVVNAIGGVPMYFSTRMRDYNSGLDIEKTGCITLNGNEALSFARSRHLEYYDTQLGEWKTDGTADLGRITRQQIFIRKVIGRAESKATGLNILATNNLVHSVIKNLKVDSSFSFTDMLGLLSDYKAFDADKLVSYTLPVTPFVTAGGADVLNLQTAQAQPTLQVFRGTTSSSKSYKPDEVTLSVENGGGVTGEAATSATKLESYGFTVSGTGNAGSQTTTTIYYGSDAAGQALAVGHFVLGGPALSEDPSLGANEVKLVIGSDFAGIGHVTHSSSSSSSSTGLTTTTTTPIGLAAGSAPKGVHC
jgi:polyisoprenyl-teichoic acid--peptidoglycan teichoic acid transferase